MTPLQCIFGLHDSHSMIPQVSTPNLHSKNKPENMKAVLFFPLRALADPVQHLPKHRNYEMLYQVFSFQWKVTIHGYQLSPIMSYPSLSVPFHELFFLPESENKNIAMLPYEYMMSLHLECCIQQCSIPPQQNKNNINKE